MKLSLSLFVFLIGLSFGTTTFAENYFPNRVLKPKRRLAFENSGKTFFPNWVQIGGGIFRDFQHRESGATYFSWTPTWMPAKNFRVRWSLGGILNNVESGTAKLLGDASMSLVFVTQVSPLNFDVGGGVQYWEGRGDWLPQVKLGIGYRRRGAGAALHGIQLSYAVISTEQVKSHQVLIGLAFGL